MIFIEIHFLANILLYYRLMIRDIAQPVTRVTYNAMRPDSWLYETEKRRENIMGFWTAMVVIVAITSVVGMITSISKHKAKHAGASSDAQTAGLEQEVAALKERIATLEKIVTDPSYDLKKQFRDLENDRVA